jgi:hypothetical protein
MIDITSAAGPQTLLYVCLPRHRGPEGAGGEGAMNRATLWGLLIYRVAAVQTYILFHPEKTSEFFFSAFMEHPLL